MLVWDKDLLSISPHYRFSIRIHRIRAYVKLHRLNNVYILNLICLTTGIIIDCISFLSVMCKIQTNLNYLKVSNIEMRFIASFCVEYSSSISKGVPVDFIVDSKSSFVWYIQDKTWNIMSAIRRIYRFHLLGRMAVLCGNQATSFCVTVQSHNIFFCAHWIQPN